SHGGAPLLGFTIAECTRWRSCAYRKVCTEYHFGSGNRGQRLAQKFSEERSCRTPILSVLPISRGYCASLFYSPPCSRFRPAGYHLSTPCTTKGQLIILITTATLFLTKA